MAAGEQSRQNSSQALLKIVGRSEGYFWQVVVLGMPSNGLPL
jgi:CRISPR/Cas system CMR-associated protein Cmr1 (group 7 of RAMP superfamily)